MASGVSSDYVKKLAEHLGWAIFPTKRGEKHPSVTYKKYVDASEKPTDKAYDKWFPEENICGAVVSTGLSKIVVLDPDTPEAYELWQKTLGSSSIKFPIVQTGKGWHFYFKVPKHLENSSLLKDRLFARLKPQEVADMSDSELTEYYAKCWDIRCTGLIVLPPSYHESGVNYRWDTAEGRQAPIIYREDSWQLNPEFKLPSVEILFTALESLPSDKPIVSKSLSLKTSRAIATNAFDFESNKNALIRMRPGDGRNVTFTKIAMYLMRHCHGDLKFATTLGLDIYNQMLDTTNFPWSECQAALLTAYNTYLTANNATPSTAVSLNGRIPAALQTMGTEPTGYISVNNANRMQVQALIAPGNYGPVDLANFWLEAVGILIEPEKNLRTFKLNVYHNNGNVLEGLSLTSTEIASSDKFRNWCTGHGLTVLNVDKMQEKIPLHSRFSMFLHSQNPPEYVEVNCLGTTNEEPGKFLTHAGIITATGLHPFNKIKPAKHVNPKSAPYEYGFRGSMLEGLLRAAEILTFQDLQTVALHCARQMALLHKSDLFGQGYVKTFPMQFVQAPSGSGKSIGFFALMAQILGCTVTSGTHTMPALRERLASHRNADTLLDDRSDIGDSSTLKLHELMRGLTSETTISKMDTDDNKTMLTIKLVGSLHFAGETLGIPSHEKALHDRSVSLNISQASTRKSTRKSKEHLSQKTDVLDLERQNLNQYAGWLIQRAMQIRTSPHEIVNLVKSFTTKSSGRQEDIEINLRYGARKWVEMFDPLKNADGTWFQSVIDLGADKVIDAIIDTVDKYCRDRAAIYAEDDSMFLLFIAEALKQFSSEDKCTTPMTNNDPPTPLWVKSGIIHYRADYILRWRKRASLPAERLYTKDGVAEMEKLYAGQIRTGRGRVTGANNLTVVVRQIDPELSKRIFELAEIEYQIND